MSARDTEAQRLQQAWLTRGPLARLLLPLAWGFGALVALRRMLYRIGWQRAERLPVPVIVVGNLIAGGAGKTPTVLALVELLRARGWRPGVVSRGYGRELDTLLEVQPATPAAQCGDEPLLLRLRAGVPVAVGRDRVEAGHELLRRHPGLDIVVCDDGLQHLRLARDVQVIVFDERGAGNGWMLPAGPLREPLPATPPPRSLVLYNAAVASTPLPGHFGRRSLAGAVALADWWHGAPAHLDTLHALRGRRLLAAAGLARPQRFFTMLREAGLDIVEHPLPDHHTFVRPDWPPGTQELIVTEKDAVKLDARRLAPLRVWVVALDFHVDAGFATALAALLPPPPPTPP